MRPRPYISYSQLMLIEKSPETYLDVYVRGKKKYKNMYMDLGSKVADSLETGDDTGDPMVDIVVEKIPKYEIRDKSIELEIKVGKEKIPVLIKPDTVSKDHKKFIEYKTGLEKIWDQDKVNKDDQITFYATGLYTITNKIPGMMLVHAHTEVDGGRVCLTGKVVEYKTKRTISDIYRMKARIYKGWKLIGELTEKELV